MVWTIAPIAGTPSYTCLGNSIIRNKINELDTAEVSCEGTFTTDTVVQIKEGATILFQGYVKQAQMEKNGKLYKLSLIETAYDLKYKIVEYSGSRSFIRTGLNVGQLVDLILTGSGWVKGTADSTAVAALGFYNATASSSMYKLIKDMQGKYLWYTVTADGVTKQAWWGDYRTDRTGTKITTWIARQTDLDTIDRNITKITVYGENSTIYGSAGSGTKEKLYRYAAAKIASECTTIATKLLADLGTQKTRVVLTLPKTNTYYAGDKVTVTYLGVDNTYIVQDVTRTQSNTVIGVGASEVSYRDTLGTELEDISGSIKSPSLKTYDGGEQSTNATNGWKQNITIPDINNVTDFKIKVRCKQFRALTSVVAQSSFLSDISQIVNNSSYTSTYFFGSGYSYLPSSYGMTCTTIGTGQQFAMATISGDWLGTSGGAWFNLECEYSTDGYSWYTAGTSADFVTSDTDQSLLSFSQLIPGSESPNLYVRWRVYPYYGSGNLRVYNSQTMTVQRVPRHYHSVTSTYDVNNQAYAITSFGVYVGGVLKYTKSAPVTQDTDYEVNITTYLATGDNNVEIRPNGKCNVNVTGSYYSV